MIRLAPPPLPAALLVCALGYAAPASAQEWSNPLPAAALETTVLELRTIPQPVEAAPVVRQRRPAALLPLYVSFGTLQALDAHSTSGALNRGGVEANPLMKPFAGNQFGLVAFKAAGTAGVVFASEQMWKKNKAAAVVFMVAANSAMAWVVQNNYRAAR